MGFGGALDAHYREQEMREQQRIDEADRRQALVDEAAEVIADDKEWLETALDDAADQIGDEERKQRAQEWDDKWLIEHQRLLRAMVKPDTSELIEAAQGIGELMGQAVADAAERTIDEQGERAA